MAQSTLHFGIGMMLATAFTMKPVLQAWIRKRPVARPIARWLLWSYAAGLWAVLPAICRRLTGIEPSGLIWNLFVAYPLMNRLPLPSIILGELLMAAILATQYGIILIAIYRHQSSQP